MYGDKEKWVSHHSYSSGELRLILNCTTTFASFPYIEESKVL